MWEHVTRDPNLVWGLGQVAEGTGWWEEVKCSFWTSICSWTLGNEKELSRKGSRYRDCKAVAQHVQRPRGTNLWEELKEGKCGQSLMQTDSEGGIGEAASIWAWRASVLEKRFALPHSGKPLHDFKKADPWISVHFANPSQLCEEWIWRVS